MDAATILRVRPRRGRLLVWLNYLFEPNVQLMDVLHMACPLLKGEKFVAQRWIRFYSSMG